MEDYAWNQGALKQPSEEGAARTETRFQPHLAEELGESKGNPEQGWEKTACASE